MREWDKDFQVQLLEAASLPEALALFCPQERAAAGDRRNPKPLSYSELSRRMGLRSRSHVREISEGLKPAPKNFPHAFCRTLKISGHWARYLELLHKRPAQKEEQEKWATELSLLRHRLRKSLARREFEGTSLAARTVLSEPELPAIFAALGDAVNGASLSEIAARTGLPAARIESCLAELMRVGAVERKESRFLASAPHLIFSELGAEEFFQKDIARSLDKARAKLKQAADKEKTLFFASTFCVQSSEIPRLRAELKQLLTRYVDSSENSQGDQIVNLVTCLS